MNTFTATTNLSDEQVAAFAAFKGYQAEVADENGDMIPNPQSKVEFVRLVIDQEQKKQTAYLFNIINEYKVQEVREAIQNEAAEFAENNVTVEIA